MPEKINASVYVEQNTGAINIYPDEKENKQLAHLRENLENFLAVSHEKIDEEKKAKKYIPSVFVETSDTKEEMRYFANPMLFFRKIDEDIRRIGLGKLNEILNLSRIEPVPNILGGIIELDPPQNLSELRTRMLEQQAAIQTVQRNVAPYSWYGEQSSEFTPEEPAQEDWEVFRHKVNSEGSRVYRALKTVADRIDIALSKIFLVTGMAGQGKTNFICDVVANQFNAFQIPSIFIPARRLNDYPGPNRILDYIINNRFAPRMTDIHELLALLNTIAQEGNKPFLFALDGINEVSDLDGFVSELRVFLEAICQYDFLKVIVTCRGEFYEQKYASAFEPQFRNSLHHVRDLRSEMSEENKGRLLESYLRHFRIEADFSISAGEFLKSDLILLRIYCENHEGQTLGYVADIYKGQIFEEYLLKSIRRFSARERTTALESLYKVCSRMFETEAFSQVSLEGFDESECHYLGLFVSEDIILRREMPATGLAHLGNENISFVYDELRDFLLSHYTVLELAKNEQAKIDNIFEKVQGWPIYEGFIRYCYVLARLHKVDVIIRTCESLKDFEWHFLNNLALLSADIQTDCDVKRLRQLLTETEADYKVRKVAWFLFSKRSDTELINVQLLLDHLNSLDHEQSRHFVKTVFSRDFDYKVGAWQEGVDHLLHSLMGLGRKQILALNPKLLATLFHFVPHSSWAKREQVQNLFASFFASGDLEAVIEACKDAVSKDFLDCLREVTEMQGMYD